MLITLLTNLSPALQTLKGGPYPPPYPSPPPHPSSSGAGILAIIGTVIGFAIGILAVVINYRRNHSFFYAFLAFLFSELYLAFVFVGFIVKKLSM